MRQDKVIIGPVVMGQKIARTLGYPTMNLELEDEYPLKYGVYAGHMEHQGKIYPGVINIGVTPHHPVKKPKLEIHLFNYNQELYGEVIKVTLGQYLRAEMKFNSIAQLIAQIQKDCDTAKAI